MGTISEILAGCGACRGHRQIQLMDGTYADCPDCAATEESYEIGIQAGLMDAYRACEWEELMYVKDHKMAEANGARRSANAIWDAFFKREQRMKANMAVCSSCTFCANGECAKDLPLPGPSGCLAYVKVTQ